MKPNNKRKYLKGYDVEEIEQIIELDWEMAEYMKDFYGPSDE